MTPMTVLITSTPATAARIASTAESRLQALEGVTLTDTEMPPAPGGMMDRGTILFSLSSLPAVTPDWVAQELRMVLQPEDDDVVVSVTEDVTIAGAGREGVSVPPMA